MVIKGASCEKMRIKKRPWTPEEDKILISHIQQFGHENWRALPKQAGLLRCGKSCRLRWINYLRPGLKRGNFTNEEAETIIQLRHSLGNKWSTIASKLPGRTDNEIKNFWHTQLKKRAVRREPMEPHSPPAIFMPEANSTIASSQVKALVSEEEPPTPNTYSPVTAGSNSPITAYIPAVATPSPYDAASSQDPAFWYFLSDLDGSSAQIFGHWGLI